MTGPDQQIAVWYEAICSGCRRPVWFLPDQHMNRCGWCQRIVVRT